MEDIIAAAELEPKSKLTANKRFLPYNGFFVSMQYFKRGMHAPSSTVWIQSRDRVDRVSVSLLRDFVKCVSGNSMH